MKITENADGTYTLDPRPGLAGWDEMVKHKDREINELSSNLSLLSAENKTLKEELKASREAHHKTTDELRKLKLAQKSQSADPMAEAIDQIAATALRLFSGKPRQQ